MICKCAHYDADEGRYMCSVSGDQCMYLINSECRGMRKRLWRRPRGYRTGDQS